ncbi:MULTISPECIES: hypothetical protein [Paraburkholderia]|nr:MULTISPECIES: hypothetical protein [Paraburkholderia]MDR8399067.1 hypothetical protein [Paraburkholderia sp. USG1]
MQSPENVVDRRSMQKTTLRQRVTTLEEALEKGASGGKKCRPFPSNHAKL